MSEAKTAIPNLETERRLSVSGARKGFMENRVVTIRDVRKAIDEKLEVYREWLERGVISIAEYNDTARILDSLQGLLLFKSRKIEIALEAQHDHFYNR